MDLTREGSTHATLPDSVADFLRGKRIVASGGGSVGGVAYLGKSENGFISPLVTTDPPVDLAHAFRPEIEVAKRLVGVRDVESTPSKRT